MNILSDGKGKIDAIDVHVGKRLKLRRIMLGLSQQDLGEAVNVSIQQVQKYEKASNRISSGKLYNLAKLLQVPINYFFEHLIQNEPGTHFVAETQEEFVGEQSVTEKDLIALIKAFNEIKDVQVRRRVIELVRTLSSKSTII